MSIGAGHAAIQEGLGVAFDALSDVFFDSSAEVLLLKASTDPTVREFDVVWVVDAKRFFHSAKGVLYIADVGMNLADPIAEATHVQIGDVVYSIKPDAIEAPDATGGTRFKWTIGLEKFTRSGQYSPVY